MITPFISASLSSIRVTDADAAGATLWLAPIYRGAVPGWMTLAVGIWLLVAVLGLTVLLVSKVQLARALAGRHDIDAEKLGAWFPARFRVRITVSARIASPVALGFRELCLPEMAIERLNAEELRAVVAHEVAHLERRDSFWLLLATVVERFMWIQPLNRVARRRLREAAEFLCDDRAARLSSPLAFASALTAVASWTARPPLAEAVGLVSRESLALRRVRRILAAPACGRNREVHSSGLVLSWVVPLCILGFLAPKVGVTLAPSGRYTITAFDDAGPFTVTLERGRVLAATMDGAPLPAPSISQSGRQVKISDPQGRIPLELSLTPQGGLSWKSRPRSSSTNSN
jgi:beta-lactamase regulating signal transducer with metallopeptidase domain